MYNSMQHGDRGNLKKGTVRTKTTPKRSKLNLIYTCTKCTTLKGRIESLSMKSDIKECHKKFPKEVYGAYRIIYEHAKLQEDKEKEKQGHNLHLLRRQI